MIDFLLGVLATHIVWFLILIIFAFMEVNKK